MKNTSKNKSNSSLSSCVSFCRDKNAVIIKQLMPIDAPVTIPVEYAKHIAKALIEFASQPHRSKV